MWRIQVLVAIFVALGIALAGKSVAGGSLVPTTITPALPDASTGKPGPGRFLVAKRALDGSHFGQTVIYLVEHDRDGSLGLIVNRPGDIGLSEALPDIDEQQVTRHGLNYGGPVGLTIIFILMRRESAKEGMAYVADDVYISSDRQVLDEILAAKIPVSEVRLYFGYSGWAAGQLESELRRGSWHVVAADTDAIFSDDTGSLWHRLIDRLEPGGIQVDSRPSLLTLASRKNPTPPISTGVRFRAR